MRDAEIFLCSHQEGVLAGANTAAKCSLYPWRNREQLLARLSNVESGLNALRLDPTDAF
jgi:hypothetical protein